MRAAFQPNPLRPFLLVSLEESHMRSSMIPLLMLYPLFYTTAFDLAIGWRLTLPTAL